MPRADSENYLDTEGGRRNVSCTDADWLTCDTNILQRGLNLKVYYYNLEKCLDEQREI